MTVVPWSTPGLGHLDAAAVGQGDAARNGQTKAEPAVRAIAPLPALRKQVEHLGQQLRLDASPLVADDDEPLAVGGAARHEDRLAGRRELGGVDEDVPDHLNQPFAVAVHEHRFQRQLREQSDAPLFENGIRALDGLRDHLGDLHPPSFEGQLAGSDARDVEQVIDEPNHVARLPVQNLELAIGGPPAHPQAARWQ